jgi:hypothetical protein
LYALGHDLPKKRGSASPAHANNGQRFARHLRQPDIAPGHDGHGARLRIHDFFP